MKKKKFVGILVSTLLIATALSAISTTTVADWDVNDGHKMHFPQLPDPFGWDVHCTWPMTLADDWECSETGWVKDIHFWGSWQGDQKGTITKFIISIHDNIPESSGGIPYSKPGEKLKEYIFYPVDWVEKQVLTIPSLQGWYWPEFDQWIYPDHKNYYQYNIFLDEEDWFWQEEDEIYWLAISAVVQQASHANWGWKSSDDHFMDDACWTFYSTVEWYEIFEPPISPVTNTFFIQLDEFGEFVDGGGTFYYDDGESENGWYYYPNTNWWNIWFWDHPFDPERYKEIVLEFDYIPGPQGWAVVAVNWAQPPWPPGNPPPVPPITPEDEDLYVGRYAFGELVQPGHYIFEYTIPDYNPEWVSVDVMGVDFIIDAGIITHSCLPEIPRESLDLAFVITGEPGSPSVDIEKKVSVDGGVTWLEEVNAKVCTNVKFKIDVHNDGDVNLNNIVIKDTLPHCLEYVTGSSTPKEPTIDDNELTWTFNGPLKPCNNITIEFEAHVISTGENENQASVTAQSIGGQVTNSDTATVTGISLIPDLQCSGSLGWSNIKPGSVVAGSFKVKNIGDPGSLLFWQVDSYPSWGIWAFTPSMGTNLKPEDGEVTIDVTLCVPKESNKAYSGQVKIVNLMDPTDYCTIPISLTTPVDNMLLSPEAGHLYAGFLDDSGLPLWFLNDISLYLFKDVKVRAISYDAEFVKLTLENQIHGIQTFEITSDNELYTYNFGKLPIGRYTLTAEAYKNNEVIESESIGIFSLSI